ncbi:hypothetical protein GUJ93_ZPchr0008g13269 [Zizania palustris]|nr:hypothetical protein GUJ93_ZPchr0008g13269 [Zizania palustris]
MTPRAGGFALLTDRGDDAEKDDDADAAEGARMPPQRGDELLSLRWISCSAAASSRWVKVKRVGEVVDAARGYDDMSPPFSAFSASVQRPRAPSTAAGEVGGGGGGGG